MKVAIINTVALNGGDAAILIAVELLVRRAFGEDVQVEIFDRSPEAFSRYYPEFVTHLDLHQRAVTCTHPLWRLLGPGTSRARWRLAAAAQRAGRFGVVKLLLTTKEREELEALASADIVVSTGGTYLVENYVLTPRIFNLELVGLLGRPLVLMTQSMGPFRELRNRRRLGPLLDAAKLILLRDPASLRHLEDLGVKRPARRVVADAVFALADPERLERARSRKMPTCDLDVVVSVRHWPYFAARGEHDGMRIYRNSIASLIEHLVARRSARVTLLSTCQGIEEYWTDDSEAAAAIHAGLSREARRACTLDRDTHRPAELIARYAKADLIVATRMHAAIIGLIAGTPVLPIEYEFKMRELFAQLGFEEWVVDIERIDAESLIGRAEDLLSTVDVRRSALLDGVRAMHEDALESAKWLGRACP